MRPIATASVAPPADPPKEKDWLWEVVGGDTQRIFWRHRAPSGAVVCERWRLLPEGAAAQYRGTIEIDPPSGADENAVVYRYDGNPPTLDAPAMRRPPKKELACEDTTSGEWFLSNEACLDPNEKPKIEPKGCLRWANPGELARVRQAEADAIAKQRALRQELAERLEKATMLWIDDVKCEQHWVRHKGRATILESADDQYPWHFHLTANGIRIEEEAETNPHLRKLPGKGERIGLGCCDSRDGDVISLEERRAVVELGSTKKKTRESWWFDKTACLHNAARGPM